MNDREERIRAKAYELWEQADRPEGQEASHWAEAERQIDAGQGMTESPGANLDQTGTGQQETESAEREVVVRRKRKDSVKPVKASRG